MNLSLLNPPLSITTHQLEQAGQFSTRNDRLFVVKGLVPFRQSHLSVGNAACPVPAKPCIENTSYFPLLALCVFSIRRTQHNDHTQRRIEGDQHPRHTNVTTPSIHGFAGTDVSPYGCSRDGIAAVPKLRIPDVGWKAARSVFPGVKLGKK